MSKKVKIYCYKLAKQINKTLRKKLTDKVGPLECESGYVYDELGVLFFVTSKKLKKQEEITFSDGYTFAYSGGLYKTVSLNPSQEEWDALASSTEASVQIAPGKEFMTLVDPEQKYLQTVIIEYINSLIFNEPVPEATEEEAVPESRCADEEIIVTGYTEPFTTDDEEDLPEIFEKKEEEIAAAKAEHEASVEQSEECYCGECEENSSCSSSGLTAMDENSWFNEDQEETSEESALEELHEKVEALQVENYRLSQKLNNTIEEIKNLSILDIILWRWKTKLLEILDM